MCVCVCTWSWTSHGSSKHLINASLCYLLASLVSSLHSDQPQLHDCTARLGHSDPLSCCILSAVTNITSSGSAIRGYCDSDNHLTRISADLIGEPTHTTEWHSQEGRGRLRNGCCCGGKAPLSSCCSHNTTLSFSEKCANSQSSRPNLGGGDSLMGSMNRTRQKSNGLQCQRGAQLLKQLHYKLW